jgi:hypothetical protein
LPAQATVRWVAPPLNRPQDSLTGTVYGGQTSGLPAAWVVAPTAPQWLLAGTGLRPGSSIPHLVASECDVAVWSRAQPPGLAIVAASPMRNIGGGITGCDSTWYRAASGAYVFDAGITDWTFGLDNFGQHAPFAADPRVQKLAQNMLDAFGARPATPDPAR